MNADKQALEYFVQSMASGHIEYRNGELWRLWELRRGFLPAPKRAEKRAHKYYMLRTANKTVGKDLHVMAHRVIWAYFNGTISDDMEINHKNGNTTDNRIENLEVVTRLENIIHARNTGLLKPSRGDAHYRCKLNDEDVAKIRSMAATGQYQQKDIAVVFGVRPNQISRILSGKRR